MCLLGFGERERERECGKEKESCLRQQISFSRNLRERCVSSVK